MRRVEQRSRQNAHGEAREHTDQGGFTLIEVTVVLAILALLGGLVLTRGPQHSATLDLRTAVSVTAGALRVARSRAIAANRPVLVLLDSTGVTVSGLSRKALPGSVSLVSMVPPGELPVRITFLPEGSATGGAVLLRTGSLSARLGVDWLSGNVWIGDARRDAS